MKAELNSKEVRTVYGSKVVRLKIDIDYSEIEDAEVEDGDILKWLDNKVDGDVEFRIGPFEDEGQEHLLGPEGLIEGTEKSDTQYLEGMQEEG